MTKYGDFHHSHFTENIIFSYVVLDDGGMDNRVKAGGLTKGSTGRIILSYQCKNYKLGIIVRALYSVIHSFPEPCKVKLIIGSLNHRPNADITIYLHKPTP